MRTEHIVIGSHNRHITAREIEDRFFLCAARGRHRMG
ncbi:Uncharacterised protein [Vibrio cholerae]|nr:Uncharacterised protein [Vibrio cholerae]CSI58492.1 Uncharacterised protein [Vibrio cholerae]